MNKLFFLKNRILLSGFTFILFFITSCNKPIKPVLPGLDILVSEKIELIRGKRIGLVTNHTALSSSGEHIVDVLNNTPGVILKALFAPEHGIRGDREGGDFIESYIDSLTGVTVFSLYGKNRKPSSKMLDSLDLLLFDIQDIGTRFYTYISTMGLAMEAAAQKGIPFIVLDRPNPITGVIVEGPVLKPQFKSFVGMYQIPIRHGMTVAELAQMINSEGWLENGIKADLKVIPIKNWQRLFWFSQTGLPWIKTSPNMPNEKAATLYPGMGLLEGLNISEGRGTLEPFIVIGAPWFEPEKVKEELPGLWVNGVEIQSIQYTPVSMPGVVLHPEYEEELCFGFRMQLHDPNIFRPVSFFIQLICGVQKLYPEQIKFKRGFDRLVGNDDVRQKILAGESAKNIIAGWIVEIRQFKQIRKKYLLYK